MSRLRFPVPDAKALLLAALAACACTGAGIVTDAGATSLAGVGRDAAMRPVIGQGPDGAVSPGVRGNIARRRMAQSMAAAGLAAPASESEVARSDYLLHCSGCHGTEAAGSTLGRIPPLRERIGNFLWLPEGRAFLVQVPGVNNTGLDNASIARVMNWVIPQFAGTSMPPTFEPYRTEEVARMRAGRPVDVATYRKSLARRLADDGHPIDY